MRRMTTSGARLTISQHRPDILRGKVFNLATSQLLENGVDGARTEKKGVGYFI